MRNGLRYQKFGRDWKHKKAMFRNLSANLLKHDSIMTTLARAKELKKIAEKMVTVAKKGGMYAYKKFGAYLYDKGAARTAYHELPVRFAERTGGYVRVTPNPYRRKGDNAKMALIEYLDHDKIPKSYPKRRWADVKIDPRAPVTPKTTPVEQDKSQE